MLMVVEDIQKIKKKLQNYAESDVSYNEPHVTTRLIERGGRRDELLMELLHPENLVHVKKQIGDYGDEIYVLFFKLGERQTLKIPVIFDRGGKKCLYMLTYIERLRSWQSMI